MGGNSKSPMKISEKDKSAFKSSKLSKFEINFSKINQYIQNNTDDVGTLGVTSKATMMKMWYKYYLLERQ